MIEMRFKIGDKVWYNFVGLKQVIVTGVYPNTNRYKIKDDDWEFFQPAENIYATCEEYTEDRIRTINNHIAKLEKQRDKLLQG